MLVKELVATGVDVRALNIAVDEMMGSEVICDQVVLKRNARRIVRLIERVKREQMGLGVE